MKKKNLIIIIAIVLFILGVIVGVIGTKDMRQESMLREEVDKISKLDITKDDIDMEIKTKGNYAEVEKTIKEYLNKYSTTLKEVYEILNDDKISTILTAENYKEDGPDFENTKKYITESRSKFNEGLDILIEMSNEEEILKAIEGKGLNEKFTQLYKDLMIGNEELRRRT